MRPGQQESIAPGQGGGLRGCALGWHRGPPPCSLPQTQEARADRPAPALFQEGLRGGQGPTPHCLAPAHPILEVLGELVGGGRQKRQPWGDSSESLRIAQYPLVPELLLPG